MANLIIDIGNTYTKIAVFDQDNLLDEQQYKIVDGDIIGTFLNSYPLNKAIISSVKKVKEEWELTLPDKIAAVNFNAGMAKGISNHYLTPATLGLDRLAAVVGAKYLYPDTNTLVIDGGTCITYDWVDSEGNYYGGSISPGLNMRYKALNYYTGGLPLIDTYQSFTADFGNDTKSAMLSGVQNGIKHELTGFINSYKKQGQQLNIVLTGGDSNFFDTLLKNSIFAPCIKIEPYLVLKGLNAAIQNNND